MKESVAAAWISQLAEALIEIAQGVGLKRTGPGDRRLVVGKRLGQPCLAQEGAAPGINLAYEELLGFTVLRVEVAA